MGEPKQKILVFFVEERKSIRKLVVLDISSNFVDTDKNVIFLLVDLWKENTSNWATFPFDSRKFNICLSPKSQFRKAKKEIRKSIKMILIALLYVCA